MEKISRQMKTSVVAMERLRSVLENTNPQRKFVISLSENNAETMKYLDQRPNTIHFQLADTGCHHPTEHSTMMTYFDKYPNTICYTLWYSKDNSTEYYSFFFKGDAEEGLPSWRWYDLKNERHVSSFMKSLGIKISRRDIPSIL